MKEGVTVAVCETHDQAENVVKELQRDGFDMKKLSIIGKDYHEEDKVVGFYNTGQAAKSWGRTGAFWGGMWGLIFGAGLFMIPGIGPVAMAGPIISSLVGGLEGAIIVGGLSALGGALFHLGIPKDSVVTYETALKANKFLVVAHGTPEEIARAESVMANVHEDIATNIHS